MAFRNAFFLGAAMIVMTSAVAKAGPCDRELYEADLTIGKRLDAAAARGKAAPESPGALLHHQPTPKSIASAEEKVGDISDADLKALTEDMQAARKANAAGDLAACQKALADVPSHLGP
jgi:hypothetical protein